MNVEEIKRIQTGGIDWTGKVLKIDGVWGPKTAWWAGIRSLSPKRQAVLQLALGYHAMDAKEDPWIENGGPFVEELVRPSGLKVLRQPWCVAFVSHCYRKANVHWPIYHVSTFVLLEWAEKLGYLVDEPLPGDIVAFLHDPQPGDTYRKGHSEISLGVDSNWLYDVGGNVADAVRVGKRQRNEKQKFIRILNSEHGQLSNPVNLMRIDRLADR